MNIIVVTHDLTEYNAHLMPWRTVCEVVRNARSKGIDARLVSLGAKREVMSGRGIPSGTLSIVKEKIALESELRELTQTFPCDAIVWPVVWREPYWRIKAVTCLRIPVVGYFPGGVYRLADVLYASKHVGLRGSLPYLADAVWPKQFQLRRWKKRGFKFLIAMTSFTAKVAVAEGWPGWLISAIPPGREEEQVEYARVSLPADFEEWRQNRPFYVFAGPPSGIRGVYELLNAFDRLAEAHQDARLVCLFRSDAPLESEPIARVIANMKYSERVYTIWESLSKPVLEAFMSECHGLVLPFLTVPSEIPLAIIEGMRFAKPVITTMTGGTGEFVEACGEAVALGDVPALADSMLRLLTDPGYYQEKCDAAGAAYRKHPTWNVMADEWIECVNRALVYSD
jgi:glycosyltransferase involved in cell wall biosynthesis